MFSRLRSILFVTLLGAAVAVIGANNAPTSPSLKLAHTYFPSVLNAEGLDSCHDYSSSTWNAAMRKPYYYALGVYLGGATATAVGCATQTAAFYQNLASWMYVMPLWDGKQCGSKYSQQMSPDTATDRTQGSNAADNAIAALKTAGLTGSQIVYLDLEAGGSGCSDNMRAYADGWDRELQAQGYKAGVYGSACSPAMSIYAGAAHVPNDVWIAEYNGGDNTVSSINSSCIPTTDWDNHQRIHQYNENVNFSYGGVTVYVDHDCVNATVDGPGSLNTECNE